MSRRIEVELTSDRGDGSWTWRAAGAKQPKGVVDATLLPAGSSVGDVVKAEAEFDIEGIEVVAVQALTDPRKEPERLEILGSGRAEPDVITNFVERKGRGKGKGKGRGDRKGGRDRGPRGKGRGRDDERGRDRKPKKPRKPKAPRLRPKRTHRDAVLDALPAEQRPVAEQVLKGGIPAVRKAVEEQNEAAKAEGKPEIKADALVAMAEEIQPALRGAEWRDRAEAALEAMDTVDLRDVRSVVTAAESGARDEDSRALAERVREGLSARIESDHAKWLEELAATVADGRIVRALNLSSRPVKAGAPLPPDLAERLSAGASAALDADVGDKRWATALEAIARSPVRQTVEPAGIPASPSDALLESVRLHSMQVPQIAARFDIEPTPPPKRKRRKGASTRPTGQGPPKGGSTGGKAPKPARHDTADAEGTTPEPAEPETAAPEPEPEAAAPEEAESAEPAASSATPE